MVRKRLNGNDAGLLFVGYPVIIVVKPLIEKITQALAVKPRTYRLILPQNIGYTEQPSCVRLQEVSLHGKTNRQRIQK